MNATLLAAFLLAAQPPELPSPEPSMTAGQLYDGCVLYAARMEGSANSHDEREIECEVRTVAMLVMDAAEAAMEETSGHRSGTRIFCPPESSSQEEEGRAVGYPLAQAFIAYFDAHPAARSEDAGQVFERALAEKWPCPR